MKHTLKHTVDLLLMSSIWSNIQCNVRDHVHNSTEIRLWLNTTNVLLDVVHDTTKFSVCYNIENALI